MRSKFERKLADSLERRGVKYEYESLQLEYYTPVKGGVCESCGAERGAIFQRHWYTPDFMVNRRDIQSHMDDSGRTNSETQLIIEAKGRFTSADRTKMKAVKEAHPELDIRFVFMGNNKIHKNSDMRYGDWCDRHGFPWTTKEIPDEWL